MTNEIIITCPDCKTKFPLTKALTKEVESSIRAEANAEWEKKEEKYKQEIEDSKQAAEEALEKAKKQLEKRLREEISSESVAEIEDLKASLDSKAKALEAANEREIQFRKEKRELEEREKNLKLEMQRTLDKERAEIAEKAAKDTELAHQYKDLEKDTKIAQMLVQIEDLKRKAEQSSQKMQGEVFETQLEETLRAVFTFDEITEVAPGVKGGDIVQIVRTRGGAEVGKILWELKRTKSFSESWLAKLKADGRVCKADICLLVSEVLPAGVQEFAEIEGVWCSSIETCVPLAHALRATLLRVASERSIQTGKKEKSELVYEYITSIEFKGRLEAIIEAFRAMKEDLESERRATEKMFAKREKCIGQVVLNIAGMHGDLEALAGNALPAIEALKLTQK
jgi:hypothetical protein